MLRQLIGNEDGMNHAKNLSMIFFHGEKQAQTTHLRNEKVQPRDKD